MADEPSQNEYVGQVEEEYRQKELDKVRQQYRDDPTRRNDPDSHLDYDNARKEAEAKAAKFADEQRQRLAHDQEMRKAPALAGTNYLNIPHEKLYDMVTKDLEPGQVDVTGAAWNSVGNALLQVSDRLRKASADSEALWSGLAAQGARQFNSDVAGWTTTAAQAAVLSSNALATQSDAASAVRGNMPMPMKYDLDDMLSDLLTAPDPVTGGNTVRQKLALQQELHQAAADAVARYDQTLSQTAGTMPAFTPPPAFDPNAPIPQTPSTGGGGSGGGHPAPGRGGTPGGDHARTPSGGPAPAGPNGPELIRTGPPGTDGTDAARAETGHTPVNRPLETVNQSTTGGGSAGTGFGAVPGTTGGGSGRAGLRGGGGAGLGRGDGGAGSGRGAGAGGRPEGGARRWSGAGAGALAAEQAAAGRGGAAGGRGPAGAGAAPFGGTAGRGAEDKERRRPGYLLEEKPNELFGTDEPTSPAVIE